MTSAQDLLAFIDSGEKSGGILIGLILYVTWTFSLTAFSILYLFCSFGVLIFMYWEEFHFFFFLGIFFIYISSAIPKVPYNLPPQLPYPPTLTSWSWHSPVLRHIDLYGQWGSLSTNGRLRHLMIHMKLETRAPGSTG